MVLRGRRASLCMANDRSGRGGGEERLALRGVAWRGMALLFVVLRALEGNPRHGRNRSRGRSVFGASGRPSIGSGVGAGVGVG